MKHALISMDLTKYVTTNVLHKFNSSLIPRNFLNTASKISRVQNLEISRLCNLEISRRCTIEVES